MINDNKPKRYLVTSALPYANGPLHIGHLSGAYLSADIFVRYLRLMGEDVVFICGSDEHGAAITIRAKKEGVSPKEIIDKYHQLFEDTFKKVGVSFDIYHRTSSTIHHKTSQEFFRYIYNSGKFIEKTTNQYYDGEADQFLADRYITGTCPKCAHEDAYGDQCEKCGSSLSPTELIDPKSTLSGSIPELRETKHWFLPLDEHEEWLRNWISDGVLENRTHHDPNSWKNHVIGQCKSWLDSGLQARAMTRDLEWGVDVPADIPESEGKKLYVWLDAPIGYISATKQWALDNNTDWKKYWQDEDTSLIHFIGKDNIVFHCLIFPVILKLHENYNLPVNVPANQFMNLEGEKISTSKNWAVWVHEYVEDFGGQEDVLRYSLIKNMPELKDSEFTWKGFQENNNNELVNNLANFINRVIVLTNKYYGGIVPEINRDIKIKGSSSEGVLVDYQQELELLLKAIKKTGEYIESYDFRSALKTVMEISTSGNQLLQFNEPWALQKSEPETVKVLMFTALQVVGALSVIIRPFLPFSSDKLRTILQLPEIKRESGELKNILSELEEKRSIIPESHKIGGAEHLFSRITDDVIQVQIEKLKGSKEMKSEIKADFLPLKSEITYDDFAKLDMRTGVVTAAEKVKKADKLLKLQVDIGLESRTVVSGIAQQFKPEEIIGKKVVLLANLAPRKLRGIESQGMILMAEDENGKLSFIQSSDIDAENGWCIS